MGEVESGDIDPGVDHGCQGGGMPGGWPNGGDDAGLVVGELHGGLILCWAFCGYGGAGSCLALVMPGWGFADAKVKPVFRG